MDNIKLEELTCKSCGIVRTVAVFINSQSGKVQQSDIEEKHLAGLVSYVDKEAEKMLVQGLGELLPEAVFLTEEETVETKTGDYRWIIDPLDGTSNFLYNIPHFSISVALEHKGETVLGIVHHIPQDEQFYAWKNGGAYSNGKPLQTSKRSKIKECIIATGFYYDNTSRLDGWLNTMRYFIENAHNFRRFGSAALDLAWVAAGRFDVFFEYGLNPWDVAAGALLVKEAGGKVADFQGETNFLHGAEIIASGEGIHDSVLDILQTGFRQ